MAKATRQYVCQSCGAVSNKWAGQCVACEEWNSLVEEAAPTTTPKGLTAGKGRKIDFVPLNGTTPETPRLQTGIAEFDRVLGGGLVAGSAILIGGDPGIGKSTLLLQAMAALAKSGAAVAYISGEEAVEQVRMRARRLGLEKENVDLAAATSVRDILSSLEGRDAPKCVVIDSIQTMFVDNLESAPGSVGQVRASAQEFIRMAKARGISVMLVGHVTKDGQIAGPRVVEHMVDTVLYFEGERGHQFRILRAVKNRFGPADEIGVFEMSSTGLGEVTNPSALFLSERDNPAPGAVVFAGIEGSRPVLVEIQALVAPSPLATPRRAVVGYDSARLSMILAVLDARAGISFAGMDVYLNIAGGMRISEPAADLAVAAALISARQDKAMPPDSVCFGEISLSGALRPINQPENRLKEAEKLGFSSAFAPSLMKTVGESGISVQKFDDINGFISSYFGNTEA